MNQLIFYDFDTPMDEKLICDIIRACEKHSINIRGVVRNG